MSRVEALRAQIHTAVDSADSVEILEQINQLLQQPPVYTISEEMEARLIKADKAIDEGRFYTLEEFNELGRIQREARIKRHAEKI